jgi:hypothetical protein
MPVNPPKMTPEQWVEIRSKYESGRYSYRALAEIYGIAWTNIQRRADRQGWFKPKRMHPGAIEKQINERTIERLQGTYLAHTPEEYEQAIEGDAATRADVIRRHREQWVTSSQLHDEAVRALNDPEYTPAWIPEEQLAPWRQDRPRRIKLASLILGLARRFTSHLVMYQEGERKAHGFDYKALQEEEKGDPDGDAKTMEVIEKIIHMGPDRIIEINGVKVEVE